jgi:Arc/MetJ-type ribon-helix-helix transcriptional regulator
MAQRTKSRITVTIDPGILEEIDRYVEEQGGTDRSKVVGEALQSWYARILHEALVRQHAAPKSAEELEERAAWKRIRAAQLARAGRVANVSSER